MHTSIVPAVFLLAASGSAATTPNIWPLPRTATSGVETYTVSSDLIFNDCQSSPDLLKAFVRFKEQFFPRKSVPVNADEEEVLHRASVQVPAPDAPLKLGVNESYKLWVTGTSVRISAPTQFGVYHALETLSQLIVFNATRGVYEIHGGPWFIDDAPRFPHREVLLDTGRHYLPVAALKEVIQSFTYAKMNTLHWHIVDQQSFPWIAPSAPEIAQGAFSPHEMYTQEDLIDILEFTRERGIRVVFEIDTPGHAGSWCVGHPEVCPAPDCLEPLRPDTNATFDLIEKLVRDLSSISTEAYFHIGGDEVSTKCWLKNNETVDWLLRNNYTGHDGYQYFVRRVSSLITSLGHHVIGWDELWQNFGTGLDKSTVIHQWRVEHPAVKNATANGYNVLWSNRPPWYLDHLGSTWQLMYNQEPCEGLTDKECELVLGGGGEMWGETVDASDLQSTIWPRLGAVAERLWSPRESTTIITNATESRYASFRCYLMQKGVAAAPHSNADGRAAPKGPGSCYAQ